jgi:hypothetical protein
MDLLLMMIRRRGCRRSYAEDEQRRNSRRQYPRRSSLKPLPFTVVQPDPARKVADFSDKIMLKNKTLERNPIQP